MTEEDDLLQFLDTFGRVLEAGTWRTRNHRHHKYIVTRPFVYDGRRLRVGEEFVPKGLPNDGRIINSGGRLVRWDKNEDA